MGRNMQLAQRPEIFLIPLFINAPAEVLIQPQQLVDAHLPNARER